MCFLYTSGLLGYIFLQMRTQDICSFLYFSKWHRMKKKRYMLLTLAATVQAALPGVLLAGQGNEYLDMDITQLMSITVTSVAKKEQSLLDAAAAAFVITQEDIRRSGVTTLPDALAMAPGVQVARINSGNWSVSTRGFAGSTSNKLLVLIDGRSVYSPAYSGVFWDMQNTLLEDVERIEVIRGPGGTLWGANAVNGVINIITKQAQDTVGSLVRISGGNQLFGTAGRYGAKLGENTHGRAYVSYDSYGSNSLYETKQSAQDEWRPLQTGFRFDGEPDEELNWTLQGDAYRNEKEQFVSFLWLPDPPYLSDGFQDSSLHKGANILGRVHKHMGAGKSLTFKAYYDYAERSEYYYQLDFDTLDLDLQYQTPWGQRHNLTFGAGYRTVWGKFSKNFQVALSDRQDNLYNAFIQDEIALIPEKLLLTLGAKYEHNDYTGSVWQPSARILWKPQTHHAFWLSSARAVRTPGMVERQGKVLLGVYPMPDGRMVPSYVFGNASYGNEKLYAYEAGYRWQATNRLFFDAATFYYDYHNVQTLTPEMTPSGLHANFTNNSDGYSYGFELAADWKPAEQLNFALTYSYFKLDLQGDTPTVVSQSDFRTKSTPRHQVSWRGSYSLLHNLQFNLWARYRSSIVNYAINEGRGKKLNIDDALIVDANIIWTPRPGLELMLAAQNLLESQRLNFVSEYATPPTEIERSIYGKITWRF